MKKRAFLPVGALVVLASLAGCDGSGGGGTIETGEITVAVTDAATDEVDVFEVDIVSFRFEILADVTGNIEVVFDK